MSVTYSDEHRATRAVLVRSLRINATDGPANRNATPRHTHFLADGEASVEILSLHGPHSAR